ncbi:MAG: DNA repair protein RadC [Chloroflexi bacterium]|nr:DNA repair protein RadC [Chloroflexota bacterium]
MGRRFVRELPEFERPMNRIKYAGPGALSDRELLAVILGTPDALDMATEVLTQVGQALDWLDLGAQQLQQVEGIGEQTAWRLLAIAEMGKRMARPLTPRVTITSPSTAADLLMSDMMGLSQEELWVISLNTRNEVIGKERVYRGSLNTSVIRIGEILRVPMLRNAAAFIVAHNHPSGQPEPSPEDIRVTREIAECAKTMDIPLLDHVIIGHHRYVSLKERGLGFDR